ncbi:MAG: recombinase family protein [Hyphomicrobiales bacterium]|nr:recombinase family protein [Hyphomicrobiales bacterium]
MSKKLVKAAAYLRTSSAANVGRDKDSDKCQRAAIKSFAKANGYEIINEYYDAAVSGADAVNERPGFTRMLKRLATNGAKTIIVESPDRFARDLTVQLTGHDLLQEMGIELIPASAPDFFTEDTPTAVLVRQVLGAIYQFEKAGLVAKLAVARKRKREATGKCEGRKPLSETAPEAVVLARQLHRKRKGSRMSLRTISAKLAAQGYVNERDNVYNPKSIATMVG